MDHIVDYFERLRGEFRRYSSGMLTDRDMDSMFAARRGGQWGLVSGPIPLEEDAYVSVVERVELQDGRPVRLRYSYYLIVEGRGEVRGYERDPSHGPEFHRHYEDHRKEPCDEVSLGQAIEEFWDVLTDLKAHEAERGEG